MANDAAHKSGWQIFEVVFGLPFLAALILHWIAPLRFPPGFITPARISAGVIFMGSGLSLIILARRAFSRFGQPTDPGLPTREIMTTGVFAISRNPLYLGGVFVLTGISLAANTLWVLIMLAPSIVGCQFILILPEERYLTAKFGEPYRAYMARVRRWLGRK